MKKSLFLFFFIFIFATSLLVSESFNKRSEYLTPQIGLNSDAVPIGINYEYGISDNIGIGATLMLQYWNSRYSGQYEFSSFLITPSFEAAYHFTKLDIKKLDLFAGGNLGFSLYSSKWEDKWSGSANVKTGSSGFFLSPFIAGRYYFNSDKAICLKIYYSVIGDWSGMGYILGLTFNLD